MAGTSTCMAHAVLLTHSTDDPGRRRQRLDALRELAASKAEHADPAEQASLELLVQEYGLAGAMDMGGPSRRSGQQQRPIRQGQPGGQHGQHGQHGQQQPATGDEARRPKSRRGRPRPGDRPEGAEESRPDGAREGGRDGGRRGGRVDSETAPLTVASGQDGDGPPAPASNVGAPVAAGSDGPASTGSSSTPSASDSSPSQPEPSSESAPAPTAPAPTASAPTAPAPAAPAPTAPAPTAPETTAPAPTAPVPTAPAPSSAGDSAP